MKTIEVNITAEFSIPEGWEVVEHCPDPTFSEEKVMVLKIDDGYYDFFPECLKKVNTPETVLWSSDEGQTEDVIDCMNQFRVTIAEK